MLKRQHTDLAPIHPEPFHHKQREELPELLIKMKRTADYDEHEMELIMGAFLFARERYGSKLHKSLVPLVEHCLDIGKKLWEIKSDAFLIAACFLHDILKHTGTDKGELENAFGPELTMLVEGIQFFAVPESDKKGYAEDIENLLTDLSKDHRIVIFRLVHRLDDLEHLEWRKPGDRKKLIQETREIFIPLADRLGMRSLAGKLEDMAFRHTNRAIHEVIQKKLEQTRKEDETYLELVSTSIKKLLWEKNIHATVTGRIKNVYGLYRKMMLQKTPIEKLLDKIAIRIIVDDIPTCYQVVGILHTHFVHIPRTFDDYISLPKANNYRSLHTCIYPIRNIAEKPIEIQIRTPSMHQVAEYGIAAHWKYKEDLPLPPDPREHLRQIINLLDLKTKKRTPRSFYDALKKNISQQTIIIFDEIGCLTYVPGNSTVLDYARQKDILVDQKKDRVRINGTFSRFTTKLTPGDTVEFIREKPAGE